MFENSVVDILILNPYFDFNDIEHPIKHQLSQAHGAILDINYLYVSSLNIRQNFYTLYDSIFGFSGEQSGTFYSYESSSTYTASPYDSYLLRADILLDAQIDRYERTVQTVFEAIGTIGGIYEILKIVTGTLVGILIKNIYQYNTANEFKVLEESTSEDKQFNQSNDRPIEDNNYQGQNKVEGRYKIEGQNKVRNMIK